MRLGKLTCHIFPGKLLIILAGMPNSAKRIVHAPLDPKGESAPRVLFGGANAD